MTVKLRILFVLVLSGLLLGALPVTWLYGADDDHAHSSDQDDRVSASVQFILVHVERDKMEQLMDESNVQTLESIPLEKIGQCIRTKDGARIASQTRLTVVSGFEAKITVVENGEHEKKKADQDNVDQAEREADVTIALEVERIDAHRLAARFAYDRSVLAEEYVMNGNAEEREAMEQRFSLSSGVVIQAGQAHVAGASLNEDMAVVLLIKADFSS